MEVVKVYAGDTLFFIEKSKLLKATFFKSLINFQGVDDEIKTDLEADVFKFIVEHAKYGKITSRLSRAEIKKINQMADYIQYHPLMHNNFLKPKTVIVEFFLIEDWPKATVEFLSDADEYLISRLEEYDKFYVNKVTKKIGSDFLGMFFNIKLESEIMDRYNQILACLKRIEEVLLMSIFKIDFVNTAKKIYCHTTYTADKLSAIPTFKFEKSFYLEDCDNQSIVTIRDFSLIDRPVIYRS